MQHVITAFYYKIIVTESFYFLIMEWPEEMVLRLVEVYKTKNLLWDPKHKDHFKKPLREDAWREIAVEINSTAENCKRKMTALLASYRREKNKVKKSKGTGTGKL